MRDGWREARLGDICEITKGISPTLKTQPGPYPLIVTGPEPSSSESFQFDGEAVCVPLVSSTGHGHASLKRVHYAYGKFAVANIIAACLPYPDSGVDTKYLYHYLQHRKDDLIVTRMKGTANVSLSIKNLADVPVVIPRPSDQRRIVDLIAAVDDATNAAEEESSACRRLKAAHLSRHFGGQGVYSRLGALSSSRLGKMLSKSENTGEYAPYLRNANVRWGALDLEDLKTMPFTAADRIEFSLRKGDVLVCEGGEIGRAVVLEDDLDGIYFQKALHRIRCGESLMPHYLQAYLEFAVADGALNDFVSGSTIKHLTGEKLARVPVPVIELEAQQRLIDDISALTEAASAADATADALRSLRRNLLTALLSGVHEIPVGYDALLNLEEEAA